MYVGGCKMMYFICFEKCELGAWWKLSVSKNSNYFIKKKYQQSNKILFPNLGGNKNNILFELISLYNNYI